MNAPITWFAERYGTRRARALLILAATLTGLVIIAAASLSVLDTLHAQQRLWPWLCALVGLSMLSLWWWALRRLWAALQDGDDRTAGHEDTGVWGVGGPNVRTPGATGMFRALRIERKVHERDHDENA